MKQGQIQSLSIITFGNIKSQKLQFTIIQYTPNNNSHLRTFSNQTNKYKYWRLLRWKLEFALEPG